MPGKLAKRLVDHLATLSCVLAHQHAPSEDQPRGSEVKTIASRN